MSRVVLVTGGMGGLGTSICQAFLDIGDTVIATFHPEFDDPNAWLEEMEKEGYGDVQVVSVDVSSYASCQVMLGEINEMAGDVDILINNAGITRDKYFTKMSTDAWTSVIETNLNSMFNVTKNVLEGMIEKRFGRVINISSVNGVKGQAGQTNYSAAKAGVLGFTKALAQEVANKGITVNAIAPGYVATKMVSSIREDILKSIVDSVPMKRLATPQEIASLCVYLAGDMAGYITGSTIDINGGLHMS